MMERKCVYQGCPDQIVPGSPETVDLCTYHLLQLNAFVAMRIAEDKVPFEVGKFIYCHPNGASARQVALAIGYNPDHITRQIRNKRVSAVTDPANPRLYVIKQEEMIRLAKLFYCFTTTGEIATLLDVSRAVFHRYAKNGSFGPTTLNLSNDLCVRVELKSHLGAVRKKYDQLTKSSKQGSKAAKVMQGEEISVYQVEELLEGAVHSDTVTYWCSHGHLKHQKRKRFIVIKKRDLIQFIQRTMTGELQLWKATRAQLEQLYNKLTAE